MRFLNKVIELKKFLVLLKRRKSNLWFGIFFSIGLGEVTTNPFQVQDSEEASSNRETRQ
jgi:hypothetical protein